MSIKSIKKGLLREPNFEDYMESKPSDFEVKWGTNPGDLLEDKAPFLRDLVEGTLNVIDPFLAGVNTFIELLDIVVDLLSAVAGVFFDAFSLITLAIREALESVINLFTGLSLNWMLHFPTTPKSRRNPDEIMYDLGMAYIDRGDTNRPITVQDSFGATVVALWSFPNLEKLMLEFNRINKLLKGVLDTNSPLDTRFSTLDTRYEDLLLPKEHPIYVGKDTLYFSYKAHDSIQSAYDEYKVVLANKEILTANPKCFIAKRDEQQEKYYVVLGPISLYEDINEELFYLSVLVNKGAYTAQSFIPNAMTDSALSNNTYLNPSLNGQAPNFNGSLQLTQFGPIAKTVSTLAGWALIVGKGPSYSEKYKTIVVVAQRRLNRIAEQTQQLVSAIASMVSFLSLGAGSNMMLCTGTGKAEDFANALINAPLHPNYPSTDLSDINHNLSKQSSVLQKSEEAAKTLVFSGAVLLHFGISDPRADIQTLEKLLGILFKEFSAEELKETKFEPIGSRFDNL